MLFFSEVCFTYIFIYIGVFRKRVRLRNKRLRDTSNPFTLPEADFRRMFRLSRAIADDLLKEMLTNNPGLENVYSNAIPFHLKFFATLSFLAHGSDQKPTGDSKVFAQSQSMVSRGLDLVLGELLKLTGRYIKFPTSAADISSNKSAFLEKFGMPGIICAIDGTHIAIVQPPAAQNGYLFYNRKHFYSLNVLAACNADQLFVFADANYPGSVHDSAVYQMSGLKRRMPNSHGFMLGDSGFPSDKFMLTPTANAPTGSKEARYNAAHKHTRNVVERTFGCLKMRFRCLTKSRTLHYAPEKAAKITYACMMLHNICMSRNIEIEADQEHANDDDSDDDEDENALVEQDVPGQRIRHSYIQRHF